MNMHVLENTLRQLTTCFQWAKMRNPGKRKVYREHKILYTGSLDSARSERMATCSETREYSREGPVEFLELYSTSRKTKQDDCQNGSTGDATTGNATAAPVGASPGTAPVDELSHVRTYIQGIIAKSCEIVSAQKADTNTAVNAEILDDIVSMVDEPAGASNNQESVRSCDVLVKKAIQKPLPHKPGSSWICQPLHRNMSC